MKSTIISRRSLATAMLGLTAGTIAMGIGTAEATARPQLTDESGHAVVGPYQRVGKCEAARQNAGALTKTYKCFYRGGAWYYAGEYGA